MWLWVLLCDCAFRSMGGRPPLGRPQAMAKPDGSMAMTENSSPQWLATTVTMPALEAWRKLLAQWRPHARRASEAWRATRTHLNTAAALAWQADKDANLRDVGDGQPCGGPSRGRQQKGLGSPNARVAQWRRPQKGLGIPGARSAEHSRALSFGATCDRLFAVRLTAFGLGRTMATRAAPAIPASSVLEELAQDTCLMPASANRGQEPHGVNSERRSTPPDFAP